MAVGKVRRVPRKKRVVRKVRVLKGKGDYVLADPSHVTKKDVKEAYKQGLSEGAEASGPQSVGATIGQYLGHGAQKVVKMLTGFGDYSVNENSLMHGGATLGANPPSVENTATGFIVRHREYISDIYSTTAFVNISLAINPGLSATFPWLSQVADSFEQYSFRGLVFEYKSMSSDAILSGGSSSALGTVIMSTQYNSLDLPFTDKRTMENYEYANSDKPSNSFMHPIECKKNQNSISELYVRGVGTPVATGDKRLYDLGVFNIATQGMQNASSNQVVGELWCTFEIEFFKAKLNTGDPSLASDLFTASATNYFNLLAPFDSTCLPSLQNSIGCNIPVRGTIRFPRDVVDGIYAITYFITGATPTGADSAAYTAGGVTVNVDIISSAVKFFFAGANSYALAPNPNSVTNNVQITQICKITQDNPGLRAQVQLLIDGGTLPQGAQTVTIMINEMNPTI